MDKSSHNITKAEFLEKFQNLRLSVRGHSDRICLLAKVTPRQFRAAKSGHLSDPIRLSAILDACGVVCEEKKKKHEIKKEAV